MDAFLHTTHSARNLILKKCLMRLFILPKFLELEEITLNTAIMPTLNPNIQLKRGRKLYTN